MHDRHVKGILGLCHDQCFVLYAFFCCACSYRTRRLMAWAAIRCRCPHPLCLRFMPEALYSVTAHDQLVHCVASGCDRPKTSRIVRLHGGAVLVFYARKSRFITSSCCSLVDPCTRLHSTHRRRYCNDSVIVGKLLEHTIGLQSHMWQDQGASIYFCSCIRTFSVGQPH